MIEQLCLDELLLESAEEIFETMIFMNLEKAEDQDSKVDDLTALGSITFKGTLEGCQYRRTHCRTFAAVS
jgi:hypothetical protein